MGTESPILFSTEMVKAIFDLIKTKTRRLNGLKEINEHPDQWGFVQLSFGVERRMEAIFMDNESNLKFIKYPWEVDDILWVRETWADTWTPDCDETGFIYKADGKPARFPYWGDANKLKDDVWRPSIYMPRAAARLFLKVKSIRVERLQEITEKDSRAEGCFLPSYSVDNGSLIGDSVTMFKIVWDNLNAKRGYGWDLNPWIWVVAFERVNPVD